MCLGWNGRKVSKTRKGETRTLDLDHIARALLLGAQKGPWNMVFSAF
jgi:hypothetical protein